jgi:threonine dehydratase
LIVADGLRLRRLERPSADDLERALRVVTSHLAPTPLVAAELDGRAIWLKLETAQPTGSFKVRGALAALSSLEVGAHVVACSAGNHALGVAYAAQVLGVPATVVVPETASSAKVAKLRTFDVELVLAGESYGEAEDIALALARERRARFLSPYNDTDVIAGQATVALEIADQLPEVAHLVVPVGGGGLAAGCVVGSSSAVAIHGAQVAQNAAFAALMRGAPLSEEELDDTIADGIAGSVEADSLPLELLGEAPFDLTLVSEASLRRSMRDAALVLGVLIEGSAAVGLAAFRQHRSWEGEIVVVLTGANVADDVVADVLGEG